MRGRPTDELEKVFGYNAKSFYTLNAAALAA
jgi:hypothetical protein